MSTEQHKFQGSGPEKYEKKTVASVFGPLAIELLKQFPLREGETVLDVACGTGIVARHAAVQVGPAGKVTGIDLNAGMLDLARTLAPAEGALIDWHEGDAASLPFEDEQFDVVLCQQGLQFFSDRSAAVREMYRVLKRGGRLGVSVWRTIEHAPYNLAKAEALGRHVGPEAEEKERNRTPFAFGKSQALRELLSEAGFEDVQVNQLQLTADMGPLDKVVNAGSFPDLEPELAAQVVRDVHESLAHYVADGNLHAPGSFNLGTGYKR